MVQARVVPTKIFKTRKFHYMKTSRFTAYLINNREFHRHYLDLVSEWGGVREWGEEFVSF